jgi:peroxiredoxin family protein
LQVTVPRWADGNLARADPLELVLQCNLPFREASSDKMLTLMNRGSDEHLNLLKTSFASPDELLTIAKQRGVHLIPRQMTMGLHCLKLEDLIDALEEAAGATKALADAQSATTFFI